MLSIKSYYSNPNLLKKVRIRTITANQNEEFNRVIQNSFTDEKEIVNIHTENDTNLTMHAAW